MNTDVPTDFGAFENRYQGIDGSSIANATIVQNNGVGFNRHVIANRGVGADYDMRPDTNALAELNGLIDNGGRVCPYQPVRLRWQEETADLGKSGRWVVGAD